MIRTWFGRELPRAALIFALMSISAPLLAARHVHRAPPPPLPREAPAPTFDAPLGTAPLDTPLVVTGGFGEYRIGHFHAGFDFSTGGVTGKPVYAPLPGHLERIRTSGVGYGRSLYLRTTDGRTIQFGHLDAFVEPIASWVRAVQDSSGQYEQDLWPEASRFPIRQGQQIAWTGQSGAGGPHMHFEIRRGDMAYMPARAGLRARDDRAPTLVSLTLEPLDDTSYVERGAAPYTLALGARAETLSVIGRVRAIVGSRDGSWSGVDRMQPWVTRMDWDGQWVQARFDSISWATDMVESDYVYDAGRVIGEKGIVLWAPAGWRPRVIRSSAPVAEEAGTIVMRPNDAPKTLVLSARDAAGNRTEARVVVRAPKRGMGGSDPHRTIPKLAVRKGADRFEYAALPGGFLRVTYRGVKARSRGIRISICDSRPASPGFDGWTAIVSKRSCAAIHDEDADVVPTVAAADSAGQDLDQNLLIWDVSSDLKEKEEAFYWRLPKSALFEDAPIVTREGRGVSADSGELLGGRSIVYVGPLNLPLRGNLEIGAVSAGLPHEGICRLGNEGWEWVGGHYDQKTGMLEAESRHLGSFALFSDTLAPRIGEPRSAGVKGGPYPRWAIEASLVENGSGVDARASWIEFDGKRCPSEWDPEAGVLRWRPAKRPDAGTHQVDVVAGDKAGNTRRRHATLVLD